MRLNKFIAHNSSYSRREAEKVIANGDVKIEKEVVTDPARDVDEESRVYLHNKLLKIREGFTVIVYNKPKGELVTKSDPKGRRTIYDTLGKRYGAFMPIGRLDFASEGLLLLTDSSEVADTLMTSKLERVYNIKVSGDVPQDLQNAMKTGLHLDDATAGAHEHSRTTSMDFAPFVGFKILKDHPKFSRLRIALNEGKNREIRRFFAYFERDVLDLRRVSFGGIELNDLPEGKTRFLEKSEYNSLHKYLKLKRKESNDKDSNNLKT